MPNILENSMIKITDRGDYKCNIIPIKYDIHEYSSTQLYLVYSVSNGLNYWAYYNKYVDKFRLCELITQPTFNGIIHKHYLNIFIPTNKPHDFQIYELSAKRFIVPNFYTILNGKYIWDNFCDEFEESDQPIAKIIHIKEIIRYIRSFL